MTRSVKMTWAAKNEMDGEKMTWRAKTSVYKSTVSEDQWLHSWLSARGSNPRRCTLKRTQPVQEGRGKRIASTLVSRKVVEKNFAQISLHRLTFREKNNKQNVSLFIRLDEVWIPKSDIAEKRDFLYPKSKQRCSSFYNEVISYAGSEIPCFLSFKN